MVGSRPASNVAGKEQAVAVTCVQSIICLVAKRRKQVDHGSEAMQQPVVWPALFSASVQVGVVVFQVVRYDMIFSVFQHELSYAEESRTLVPILQVGACLASNDPDRKPS